tara:strand:- start:2014 stop:2379 length:366 start_codon:yes stop_codon:yes gene_type:complete
MKNTTIELLLEINKIEEAIKEIKSKLLIEKKAYKKIQISEALYLNRKHCEATQQQAADFLKISLRTYIRYENGYVPKGRNINLALAESILDKYSVEHAACIFDIPVTMLEDYIINKATMGE